MLWIFKFGDSMDFHYQLFKLACQQCIEVEACVCQLID